MDLRNLFTAKKAKEKVEKYYSNDLNYQRRYILDRIEGSSLNGDLFLVIDYSHIRLNDEDYNFFIKLGYDVKPESTIKFCKLSDRLEYYRHTYGIISW